MYIAHVFDRPGPRTMNFKAMPELEWPLGYPWALALIVITAIVPFVWFRRMGWL